MELIKDILFVEYWSVTVDGKEVITGATDYQRLYCKIELVSLLESLKKYERIYPNITIENFNIQKWLQGCMSEPLVIIDRPYEDVDKQKGQWRVELLTVEMTTPDNENFYVQTIGQPEQLSLFD